MLVEARDDLAERVEHRLFPERRGIAERELGSDALIARHRLAHVERHRHGPERAVRKPHLAADAIVIRTRHETAQR